eukprot:g70973.t1
MYVTCVIETRLINTCKRVPLKRKRQLERDSTQHCCRNIHSSRFWCVTEGVLGEKSGREEKGGTTVARCL